MAGVPWTMCVRLLLTLALLQTARATRAYCMALYKRNANMDGLQLTYTTLFQASEVSTRQCGIRCSREKRCRSFAFTAEQSSSCCGYDVNMTSSRANDTVSAAGVKSFELVNADWLGAPCSQNSECPICQSECFKGQCLCTPGYFYSEGSKACFPDCPQADLRGGFIKYPTSAYIVSSLLSQTSGTSLSLCQDMCFNTFPACRSFNYNPGTAWCGLLPHAALNTDFGTYHYVYAGHDYHQMTCA